MITSSVSSRMQLSFRICCFLVFEFSLARRNSQKNLTAHLRKQLSCLSRVTPRRLARQFVQLFPFTIDSVVVFYYFFFSSSSINSLEYSCFQHQRDEFSCRLEKLSRRLASQFLYFVRESDKTCKLLRLQQRNLSYSELITDVNESDQLANIQWARGNCLFSRCPRWDLQEYASYCRNRRRR